MRGTQMIAAVKIISIGFDIDREKIRDLPNFLQFWGYILCPGNVVMGPWCSFNDYLQIFHRTRVVSLEIYQNILNKSFFYKCWWIFKLKFHISDNQITEMGIPIDFECSFSCSVSGCIELLDFFIHSWLWFQVKFILNSNLFTRAIKSIEFQWIFEIIFQMDCSIQRCIIIPL